jgi:peptidoglycan/LPS O-acetylase OafA/YrhL
LYHVGFWGPGTNGIPAIARLTPVAKYGFLGVPAFFVISGFFAVGLLINQFYRGRRDPMLYGLMQAPVTS